VVDVVDVFSDVLPDVDEFDVVWFDTSAVEPFVLLHAANSRTMTRTDMGEMYFLMHGKVLILASKINIFHFSRSGISINKNNNVAALGTKIRGRQGAAP
jgi:hypothetical protein